MGSNKSPFGAILEATKVASKKASKKASKSKAVTETFDEADEAVAKDFLNENPSLVKDLATNDPKFAHELQRSELQETFNALDHKRRLGPELTPVSKSASESAEVLGTVDDARLARQKDLEQALTMLDPKRRLGPELTPVSKSAADSADVFTKQGPNFEMVPNTRPVAPNQSLILRDPTSPMNTPNFNMQGGPRSTGFTHGDPTGPVPGNKGIVVRQPNEILDPNASAPKGIVPRGEGGVSVHNPMRDVTDVARKPMSPLLKYGAPIAGTGILASMLMGGDGENAQGQPPVPMRDPRVPIPTTETANPNQPGAQKANVAPKSVQTGSASGGMSIPEPGMTLDFGDGYKDTAGALKEVMDRRDRIAMANELGKAAEIIGTSIAGTKPIAQGLFDANIKGADKLLEDHKLLMEKEKNDPNSPLSKGMKQFMKSFGFNVQGDASAEELMKLSPLAERYFNHVENRRLKAEENKQRHLDRQAALEINRNNKAVSQGEKKDRFTEQQRERLGRKLSESGLPTLMDKISQIESTLGMSIEDALQKKPDIPGYGLLARQVPDFMSSEQGEKMRRLVSGLSNIELKKRSGAAVTDPEFQRFLQEFGSGRLATERSLLTGLKQLKDAYSKDVQTIRSGFNQDAVQMYEDDFGSDILSGNGQQGQPDPAVEAKIQTFMSKNPQVKSREEAVSILKQHGKL
jgi:hypothetical protein